MKLIYCYGFDEVAKNFNCGIFIGLQETVCPGIFLALPYDYVTYVSIDKENEICAHEILQDYFSKLVCDVLMVGDAPMVVHVCLFWKKKYFA